MTDRPKTATADISMDGAAITPTFTYAMLKQATESWRNPSNGWTKPHQGRTVRAAVSAVRQTAASRNWGVSIGPNNGGFLPILNISTRKAALSSRQMQKRNKSATTRRHSVAAGAGRKPVSTAGAATTASMMDLTTITAQPLAERGNSVPRLHRESSLPVHLGTITPMLKYSNDSQEDFFQSHLALIERANKPELSSEAKPSQSSSTAPGAKLPATPLVPHPDTAAATERREVQETSPRSHAVSGARRGSNGGGRIIRPAEQAAEEKQMGSGAASIGTGEPPPTRPYNTRQAESEFRLKLNIRLPDGDTQDSDGKADSQKSNALDSDSKSDDQPKSILKPPPHVDSSISEAISALPGARKQPLELSTYILTPPLRQPSSLMIRPPTTPQSGCSAHSLKTRPKRVRLKENSSIAPPADDSGSEAKSLESLSSPTSEESNLASATDSLLELVNGETNPDLPKSVRFCDKPDRVREYCPWEAPCNSLLT